MSKVRREKFEVQLQSLQKDINNLTEKLTSQPETSSYEERISELKWSDIKKDKTFQSHTKDSEKEAVEVALNLRRELHETKEERDDMKFQLEQMKLELDELRKQLSEMNKIKSSYNHLKQDHESLRISLESSERIRKQQKELINILQRSHSIAAANDTGSLISFNSLSTISHKPEVNSVTNPIDQEMSSEHREWLNTGLNRDNGIIYAEDNLNIPVSYKKQEQQRKPTTRVKKSKTTKKQINPDKKTEHMQSIQENFRYNQGRSKSAERNIGNTTNGFKPDSIKSNGSNYEKYDTTVTDSLLNDFNQLNHMNGLNNLSNPTHMTFTNPNPHETGKPPRPRSAPNYGHKAYDNINGNDFGGDPAAGRDFSTFRSVPGGIPQPLFGSRSYNNYETNLNQLEMSVPTQTSSRSHHSKGREKEKNLKNGKRANSRDKLYQGGKKSVCRSRSTPTSARRVIPPTGLPTKVLYRAKPSPSSTFGTASRLV